MATPRRTPQDRKTPAPRTTKAAAARKTTTKVTPRRPTAAELGPDTTVAAPTPAKKAPARKATAGAPGAFRAAAKRSTSKGQAPATDRAPGLAAEAGGALPVQRPEGCPDFVALHVLDRRTRAKYLRALDNVNASTRGNADLVALSEAATSAADSGASAEEVMESLQKSPSVLRVTADIAEMAADLEDVLRIVAVDELAYNTWVRRADDEDLLAAFGWYQEFTAAGEA